MMRLGRNRRFGGLVGVAFAFVLAGACESQSSSRVGGETHWLDACDHDADCERGGCLCGVCTEPCGGDDSCAGDTHQAGCFAVASAGLVDRCGATVKAHGVCLALCAKDADCPTGEQCYLGACVARTGSGGDASTADVDPSLPHASDFADVDAAMDFSRVIVLPAPSTTIEDATDAFLGTWVQTEDRYYKACTPGPCLTVEVEKTSDGFVGFISVADYPTPPSQPKGPFAPATDPNAGYPTEATPATYWSLSADITPGARYRLLDGIVAGSSLSFWYTSLDLWSEWCALQTPHAVVADGARQQFRCVDPSADETNTDPGKLKLCRSSLDGDQCTDADGVRLPCSCFDSKGRRIEDVGTCLPLDVCSCSSTGCRANLRRNGVLRNAKLILANEALTGVWTAGGNDTYAIEFRKVSP